MMRPFFSSSSKCSHVAHLPTRFEFAMRTRGATAAAVDDEVLRALGDLGIEVVVQHAKGGFLDPALAGDLGATRSAHGAGGHGGLRP
jgi:hypothetical protein